MALSAETAFRSWSGVLANVALHTLTESRPSRFTAVDFPTAVDERLYRSTQSKETSCAAFP